MLFLCLKAISHWLPVTTKKTPPPSDPTWPAFSHLQAFSLRNHPSATKLILHVLTYVVFLAQGPHSGIVSKSHYSLIAKHLPTSMASPSVSGKHFLPTPGLEFPLPLNTWHIDSISIIIDIFLLLNLCFHSWVHGYLTSYWESSLLVWFKERYGKGRPR